MYLFWLRNSPECIEKLRDSNLDAIRILCGISKSFSRFRILRQRHKMEEMKLANLKSVYQIFQNNTNII